MERELEREYPAQSYQRVIDVVRRANYIAACTALDELLEQTLDLFIEVADAEAGTLYLYDAERDQLSFRVVRGGAHRENLIGTCFSASRGIAGAALRANQPLFVEDVERDPRWERQFSERSAMRLHTAYCLPLTVQDRPVGVVQVFNLPISAVERQDDIDLLHLLANCMVSEIEKARLLDEAQRRGQRLNALVDVISRLTATLDRDELLRLIMDHARELLEVEATSVWELDERRNLLALHAATGERGASLSELTVPVGHGIIGHVVQTGKMLRVEDVREDPRHNKEIDQKSGFQTRSVLCVPMRAPAISLGSERGKLPGTIIGGAQALNKRDGRSFTTDDVALFQTFADQAATVLQLSRLYHETHNLFLGVIKVVAGAIDAKDPYTQGHSQRVADFAVAIAEELIEEKGLTQDDIYHIKIGGILHDVGKIGIPDAILQKQEALSATEFEEIKKHPLKGYEIMSHAELAWLLKKELPALLQHHERLDGNGYPQQLRAEEIGTVGRIMAVADVFDALTSDRPYRPGDSAEVAIAYLRARAGTEFDPACVEALCRARERGKIQTQSERIS